MAFISKYETLYFKEFPGVTFFYEDLLLGKTNHNCPLYILIYIGNFKLLRFLVGLGASVNMMNIKTLSYLKVDTNKLTTEKFVICKFNRKR